MKTHNQQDINTKLRIGKSSIYTGRYAGALITEGTNNICIGHYAGADPTTESNVVIIGDNIRNLDPKKNKNVLFLNDKIAIGNTLFGKPINLRKIIVDYTKKETS